MKIIPREAKRVTYSTEIRNLKTVPLSEIQRAVVIGNILGDGCLCENWSKTNYRLIISHSIDQKEYIEWKYQILKRWILTEPRFYEKNRSFTIRTVSHPELTEFRNLFYPQGKKIIPENIEDLLSNPLTLAVWYMDDGNNVVRNGKSYGYHINTQSFSYEENEILARVLNDLYEIEVKIEKNKGKYRLAIWKRLSRDQLRDQIEYLMLPSMKYKLG